MLPKWIADELKLRPRIVAALAPISEPMREILKRKASRHRELNWGDTQKAVEYKLHNASGEELAQAKADHAVFHDTASCMALQANSTRYCLEPMPAVLAPTIALCDAAIEELKSLEAEAASAEAELFAAWKCQPEKTRCSQQFDSIIQAVTSWREELGSFSPPSVPSFHWELLLDLGFVIPS